MQENEQEQIEEAKQYIKEHKRELLARFADPKIYVPDERPVSLFMAGSPGAGKTEMSKRLIELFSDHLPVRIDADEIRVMFTGYTGANSHIFQQACSIGVNKLFDHVIEKRLNAILDGTFAYERVMENIERSLSHGRRVVIYYLFQEPLIAWKFTIAREATEGRRVSRETFINAFIKARQNVDAVKAKFGNRVELNVVIKNFDTKYEEVTVDVQSVDKCLPAIYTQEELEKML